MHVALRSVLIVCVCVECTDLEAADHQIVTCNITENGEGRQCSVICEDGYLATSTLQEMYECGINTGYVPSHQVFDTWAQVPTCTRT